MKKNKFETLVAMDKYLRKNIEDEEIFINDWLANGVPDEADDEIIDWIAGNQENYVECLESFVRCLLADC